MVQLIHCDDRAKAQLVAFFDIDTSSLQLGHQHVCAQICGCARVLASANTRLHFTVQ